jgi:hypothetical protein
MVTARNVPTAQRENSTVEREMVPQVEQSAADLLIKLQGGFTLYKHSVFITEMTSSGREFSPG